MTSEEIAKPAELLAAHASAEALFVLLRRWFDVPEAVTLDLASVDSADAELADPRLVMAMAMRKLQTLHLLSTPGVRTTTDVVLSVIQDLERALLQAPALHVRRAAEAADWDAALAALDPDGEPEVDGDLEAFRRHHATLHEAARAVLHASHGEIRTLV